MKRRMLSLASFVLLATIGACASPQDSIPDEVTLGVTHGNLNTDNRTAHLDFDGRTEAYSLFLTWHIEKD